MLRVGPNRQETCGRAYYILRTVFERETAVHVSRTPEHLSLLIATNGYTLTVKRKKLNLKCQKAWWFCTSLVCMFLLVCS